MEMVGPVIVILICVIVGGVLIIGGVVAISCWVYSGCWAGRPLSPDNTAYTDGLQLQAPGYGYATVYAGQLGAAEDIPAIYGGSQDTNVRKAV
jgi:hypothetical protein